MQDEQRNKDVSWLLKGLLALLSHRVSKNKQKNDLFSFLVPDFHNQFVDDALWCSMSETSIARGPFVIMLTKKKLIWTALKRNHKNLSDY